MKTNPWIAFSILLLICSSLVYGQQDSKKELDEALRKQELAEMAARVRDLKLRQTESRHLLRREKLERLMSEKAVAEMAFDNDQREEVLNFLEENAPSHYKFVRGLKSKEEDLYNRYLKEAMWNKLTMAKKAGDDKNYHSLLLSIYGLDTETKRLVESHNSAAVAEKSTIRNNLRVRLAQLFDLREEEREREVRRLEEKLTALHENLRLRQQNKDLIVDNRLKQLLGEASSLQW